MEVFHQSKQLHRNLKIPWRKALRLQFSSGWNAVGLLMVVMFLLYHVLWLAGYLGLPNEENSPSRKDILDGDFQKVLVSYGFNSFGFLFAFIYLLSFTSVNPYVGPLQYALIEMFKGVLKFAFFFAILFFGFSFSFKKVYLQYAQSKHKLSGSNVTSASPGSRHRT